MSPTPDPLQPILGAPWDVLTASHVEAFLAEQGDEGQLWDCKSDADARGRQLAKDVCAFANTSGGYLVLGARRETDNRRLGSWLTPGFRAPNPEPETWVIDKLLPVLSPLPTVSVRQLDRPSKEPLVVVRVLPLPNPPCLLQGTPYVRIASVSAPVNDQGVLFELMSRGRRAQEACEYRAHQASVAPPGLKEMPPDSSRLAVGAAAVAYPDGVGLRVHGRAFADALIASMGEELAQDDFTRRFARLGPVEHRQDAVIVPFAFPVGGPATALEWWVRVSWTGEVSVVWTDPELATADVQRTCSTEGPLGSAWRLVKSVIALLGGNGAGRIYVSARSSRLGYQTLPTEWTTAGRHLDLSGALDADQLASVEREMLRAAGCVAFEP